MARTRGIHWAHTTHGTWLHGDWRGSWKDGRLIGPDPFLENRMRRRMHHTRVALTEAEQQIVAEAFGQVIAERHHRVLAATIQSTHIHLVFAPLGEPIEEVITRFNRRSAAAVFAARRDAGIDCPRHLWTAGRFPRFIFDDQHLRNAIEYVRKHNTRTGRPRDPYEWIARL